MFLHPKENSKKNKLIFKDLSNQRLLKTHRFCLPHQNFKDFPAAAAAVAIASSSLELKKGGKRHPPLPLPLYIFRKQAVKKKKKKGYKVFLESYLFFRLLALISFDSIISPFHSSQ